MIRIKVVTPKNINFNAMYGELMGAMNDVGNGIQEDFEGTVQSWNEKPDFTKEVIGSPSEIVARVSTDNKIYAYVNDGTPPHRIEPKNKKVLKFQSGYNAKTTPGLISSHTGGPYGDVVYSRGVNHPGTEPRDFEKNIAKIWEKDFPRMMNNAMGKVARASGHEV